MVAKVAMNIKTSLLLISLLSVLPCNATEQLKGKVEQNNIQVPQTNIQVPLEDMGHGAWKTPGTIAKWVKTIFCPGFQYNRETGEILRVHPNAFIFYRISPGDYLLSIDGHSIHGYKWNYDDPCFHVLAVKQKINNTWYTNHYDCPMEPIQTFEPGVEVKSFDEVTPKVNI